MYSQVTKAKILDYLSTQVIKEDNPLARTTLVSIENNSGIKNKKRVLPSINALLLSGHLQVGINTPNDANIQWFYITQSGLLAATSREFYKENHSFVERTLGLIVATLASTMATIALVLSILNTKEELREILLIKEKVNKLNTESSRHSNKLNELSDSIISHGKIIYAIKGNDVSPNPIPPNESRK